MTRTRGTDVEAVGDEAVAARLIGRRVPDVRLRSAHGEEVDLRAAAAGVLVLFVYPRTGVPGERLPGGWDRIRGARGCTAEACAFRDLERELREQGATVIGVSAQPLGEQREFAARQRVPYPLLNDSELKLAAAVGLPTFEVERMALYKRLTLIVVNGRIEQVLHRDLEPNLHPVGALDWLRQRQETT